MANMPWLEQRAIAMKEKIQSNILKKLRSREIERLRVSLEMAKKAGYQKITGMIFVENETKDVLCFFML